MYKLYFLAFLDVKLLAINANKKNADNLQFIKAKKYGNNFEIIFLVSRP